MAKAPRLPFRRKQEPAVEMITPAKVRPSRILMPALRWASLLSSSPRGISEPGKRFQALLAGVLLSGV